VIKQIIQIDKGEFGRLVDFFHVHFPQDCKKMWETWLVSWQWVNDFVNRSGQLIVESVSGGVCYVSFF